MTTATVDLSPVGPAERRHAVRRAVVLNRFTILYNTIEGCIALVAGAVAGSVSLVAFGLDSTIELSASIVLAWRLRAERRDECTQDADRRATKAIAVSFLALAAYVTFDAARCLIDGERPDASAVGIALTATSLALMPLLARAKARLAPTLGSQAQAAEANQTRLCAWLSGVALTGLLANQALGWWWADPVAAFGIAAFALVEGVRTWRADSLADTCCA